MWFGTLSHPVAPRRTLFGLHPITCCALGSVSFMPSTFVKTTLGPMLWERGDGGLQGRRPLRSRNGRFFYGPISRPLGRGLTRRPMAGGLEIAWGDWGCWHPLSVPGPWLPNRSEHAEPAQISARPSEAGPCESCDAAFWAFFGDPSRRRRDRAPPEIALVKRLSSSHAVSLQA